MITAERYKDISCGHRVCGHESKCRHLHGHNYRIHFIVGGRSDELGRVLDFGVIKTNLCNWLERHYDHRMLIWSEDPLLDKLQQLDPEGLIEVPYNPTAENIARHMVETVGPTQLADTECQLIRCIVEETRKCRASYSLPDLNMHQ